jgi:hypothetical protein
VRWVEVGRGGSRWVEVAWSSRESVGVVLAGGNGHDGSGIESLIPKKGKAKVLG